MSLTCRNKQRIVRYLVADPQSDEHCDDLGGHAITTIHVV